MAQPTGLADPAKPGGGIARGAMLIAGLTILSRVLGLVRTLVFSQSIGAGCLGTAYVTANQVPNLIYELVLGGALTSAMVPVLARSAERADADPAEKARVGQITSALLTWSVVILVPLSLAIAVAAGPIATLLNPVNPNAHCPRADMIATTTSMLEVFAPQALLYGLSVVLYGLLQAYRRFAGPTIGPAVSSLVLIAAYLSFVPLAKGLPLAQLPVAAELVLSVGTTLGVAALVVVGVLPTKRLRLRLRPTLRFPPGVARQASGLAMVGVVELLVIDLASLIGITLANGRGETGAIVLFNYASQVFNAVAAVLALSIVTSAFPVLSARDGPEFARTCAGSTRAVLLMSWLGTAAMAAIAVPAAHVLARQPDQVPELVEGFALFAPGIAGTAVVANLARVMLAIGRLKVAAAALAGSWGVVIVADVALAELAPARLIVAALALGNTIGQTVVAVPLIAVTRRICGRAAVEGTGHAMLAGLAAGAVGAGVGVGVSLAGAGGGKLVAGAVALAAAACATVAFGAVAFLLDRGDLRVVARRVRRVAGRHRTR
ncbi:MAG TPA: lipid II flippase MurJ [Streptosporangiaceae bacterium]|nr:lipid II flippase MurJ [Streptosporangiaceae bacterium]